MLLGLNVNVSSEDLKTILILMAIWATRHKGKKPSLDPTQEGATVLTPVNRPSTPPSSAPKRALRAGGSPEKGN